MSKKTKTLIIVVIVLLCLGGGYFGSTIWKKKKAESSSAPYTPPEKLGNLEFSKLVKFEISDFVLEKKNDAWELVSLNGGAPPEGIELDQGKIQSMTYSLASLWIENLVEEAPEDLSVYGLDKPVRASVTDSDGKRVTYLMGDKSPSQNSSYVMEEGNPKIYTVSSYSLDSMQYSLNDIRAKLLIPQFEFQQVVQFQLETPSFKISISPKPNFMPEGSLPDLLSGGQAQRELPVYLASSFTTHMMTSPYLITRAADSEGLNKLLEPLNNFYIVDFIDENPESLRQYGFEKPSRILFQTMDSSIDLLIGDHIDGKHYAKLSGASGVFTINNIDSILNVKPFSLIDKFALLINIDSVDNLTVSGGEGNLYAEIRGKDDDQTYYLDGKQAEEKSFKGFYQAVIGLLFDAEYPDPGRRSSAPADPGNIVIEYNLNNPPGESASITLVPYNRDYYVLWQEGSMEFLISRNQVRKIFQTAETVVYLE